MRKGYIRSIVAVVIILCTIFSANISLNPVWDDILHTMSVETMQAEGVPDDVYSGAEITAKDSVYHDAVITAQGLRVNSGSGVTFFRRTERRIYSVSYVVLAVLFQMAFISYLIFGLAMAVDRKNRSVGMQILTFIHNKDGKKRGAYLSI